MLQLYLVGETKLLENLKTKIKCRFFAPKCLCVLMIELCNNFVKQWHNQDYVETNALETWKLNILNLLMEEFYFISTI